MAIAEKGLSTKLKVFLRDQSFRDDSTGKGSAQIVCLRGCRINADGSLSAHGNPLTYTDRYDDTMVVFGLKSGGQPYLFTAQASAKPGIAWIRSPSYAGSGRGCPTMQPQQARYVRGLHRNHEAMRQAWRSPALVIRDVDQDAKLELSDLVDYPWDTGINLHAGGTSSRIGRNSSGCQIIRGGWGGKPWRTFHDLIYRVARGQTIFHYVVADFRFFGLWHDNPSERKGLYSVLRFGARGVRVKRLQELLVSAGYYPLAMIDGEFGRMTDEAVRVYQRRHGFPVDGGVTQKMLQTLGGD